jgi:hypothetical protein
MLAAAAGCAGSDAGVDDGDDDGAASEDALNNLGSLPTVHAAHVSADAITVDGKGIDAAWARAPEIAWDTDFAGQHTAVKTTARFAWSDKALHVLFVLSGLGENTDTTRPVLVEREDLYVENAVELFLAPDRTKRTSYFEIELGPYGHFFDLAVDRLTRKSDTSWSSAPSVVTTRSETTHTAIIEARFTSPDILRALVSGAKLPLGLFRIEGKTPRTYLAWSPAKTRKPNFHVPEAFGTLALDP